MRLRRDYVAWALGHADRLISPSAYLAGKYQHAGVADPARLRVISNGIDLAPFAGIAPRPRNRAADEPVRFFCAAYLGRHKGIPELLDAAALLAATKERAGQWSLSIAGDGDLRQQTAREIEQGRFGRAVSLLGRVPRSRVIEEMSAADVVVLPSRWPEDEPVIMLEAIAAGRAQLATNHGGNPALVEAGITGELVPPADPQALATAMAAYIDDPERARRQGEASRKRRDTISETTAIDAIEALYAEVAADRLTPGPRDPMVLCAGDWPSEQVAIACNELYHSETAGRRVRLVWHGWVEPEIWQHAALLWNWSGGADLTVIQRALRSGLPIMAPVGCAVAAGVAASFGAALAYDGIQQASQTLALVSRGEPLLHTRPHATEIAADMIAANAPAVSYHLPTPDLAA